MMYQCSTNELLVGAALVHYIDQCHVLATHVLKWLGPHGLLMCPLLAWAINAALASLLTEAAFIHHDDKYGVNQPCCASMVH